MPKFYRCPFYDTCDENPVTSDCAGIKKKNKPCKHKRLHVWTNHCGGGGILPTCHEVNTLSDFFKPA